MKRPRVKNILILPAKDQSAQPGEDSGYVGQCIDWNVKRFERLQISYVSKLRRAEEWHRTENGPGNDLGTWRRRK